ncbi:MAG: hypothetical protein K0Q63_1758 [Paenibacillus sp.]|nr:hypothetical protein [Paenibacillus sp.]
MTKQRVFIYGSLLPGQSNHSIAAPYIRASVDGEIRGRLVDCGNYPAAIRDEAASERTIRGLWITVDPEGLAAMDALEEFAGIEEPNDYERVWATDVSDVSISGWVYVREGSRGCQAVPDRYWPDYYARKTGR